MRQHKKKEDTVMNDRNEELLKNELDLDALECVTGGAGSDGGDICGEGIVTGFLGNGVYSVDVGGQTVNAHMSGKLRMNFVRIQPGDKVRVEGYRITYKYK